MKAQAEGDACVSWQGSQSVSAYRIYFESDLKVVYKDEKKISFM